MEERYGTYYQPEEHKENHYDTDGCDPGTAARGREYQGGACRGRRVVGFWHVSGA